MKESLLIVVLFLAACSNAAAPKPGDVVNPYDDVADGGSSSPSSGPTVACTGEALTSTTCQVGPKGDKGDKGETGYSGANGLPGKDGASGPQGLPGKDGLNGAPGAMGLQGLPGTDGTNGAPGAQGLKGDKGDPGSQGIQGIAGTPGAKGADGKDGAAGGFDTNKLYTVTGAMAATPATDNGIRGSFASCNGGDTLITGGCDIYGTNNITGISLISSSPNINGSLLPWAHTCQWHVVVPTMANGYAYQLRAFALCAKP